MNWSITKNIAAIALIILVLAVVADVAIFSLVEYGRKDPEYIGCFAYDAMLVGFQCLGFPGSQVVEWWLNWPLWLIYGPLLALFNTKAAALTVVVWAPVILFIVAARKVARINA